VTFVFNAAAACVLGDCVFATCPGAASYVSLLALGGCIFEDVFRAKPIVPKLLSEFWVGQRMSECSEFWVNFPPKKRKISIAGQVDR
jgi:hypothetical protein